MATAGAEAEADVTEAVPVVEGITGLLDKVLVAIVIDIAEDDAAVPDAAAVDGAELTPLTLRVTPTLLHNCCANCTVAEKAIHVRKWIR